MKRSEDLGDLEMWQRVVVAPEGGGDKNIFDMFNSFVREHVRPHPCA